MPLALRIREWDERYEVNDKNSVWKPGQPMRKAKLGYVRSPAFGLVWGEGWRKLERAAGGDLFAAFGLFHKLLEVAASREGGLRGWILTGDNEVMGPNSIADLIGGQAERISVWLGILINKVKWVEVQQCDFAIEMENPLTGVAVEFREDRELSGNSGNSGNSRSLLNETEMKEQYQKQPKGHGAGRGPARGGESEIPELSGTVNSGGSERGHAESGETVGVAVSGGSDFSGPEDSGSEVRSSGVSGSENSGGSDSGNSDSGFRAGAREIRGGTAPFSGASQSMIKWEFDVEVLDVRLDSPRCILQNLSNDEFHSKLMVMERAMKWFKELLPQLEPSSTAREDIKKQARSDVTTIDKYFNDAWLCGGDGAVVELVMLMQQKVIAVEKSRGRLRNVMALWVKVVKEYLADAKQRAP